MEILHRQGEIIRDRYQIITTIGTGGMATTYAAIDLTNSQRVALKVLSLEQTDDWKTIELFEREAKILAHLHHPYIPQYLDYFELNFDGDYAADRRFYLVQELVEGESLAALIEQGWQPNEAEVREIALQALDILVYLHSLAPPVIHRDLKPQNIIRDRQGKIYLVDFGAVQAVYRNTISISGTFVGTLGYMSPEQLRGNVVPASDLYSLGCTLIFLLTQKLPTDLPQKRMKLDFRSEVNLSTHFADWLDRILEPAVSDRFADASAAVTALKTKQHLLNRSSNTGINRYLSDRISVSRQGDRDLKIEIANDYTRYYSFLWLIFGFICSLNTIKWLLQSGTLFSFVLTFISLTIAIVAAIETWYEGVRRTILKIDSQYFHLQWTKFSLRKGLVVEKIKGLTADIDWVNLNIDKKQNRQTPYVNTCAISEGDRQYKFGLGYNLSLKEAEDVTQEVAAFLKQLRN